MFETSIGFEDKINIFEICILTLQFYPVSNSWTGVFYLSMPPPSSTTTTRKITSSRCHQQRSTACCCSLRLSRMIVQSEKKFSFQPSFFSSCTTVCVCWCPTTPQLHLISLYWWFCRLTCTPFCGQQTEQHSDLERMCTYAAAEVVAEEKTGLTSTRNTGRY